MLVSLTHQFLWVLIIKRCFLLGNVSRMDDNVQKMVSERDLLKSELSKVKAELKALDASKTRMAGEQATANEKFQKLKAQLFTQKEYGDRMYRTNKELQQQISGRLFKRFIFLEIKIFSFFCSNGLFRN